MYIQFFSQIMVLQSKISHKISVQSALKVKWFLIIKNNNNISNNKFNKITF